MPDEHAEFSPSSLERLFKCPGSRKLSEGVAPRPPSEYAEFGTKFHSIMEEWNRTGVVDDTDDDPEMDPLILLAQEMQATLHPPIEHVTAPGHAEERVTLSPLVWGTCDFHVLRPNGTLVVVDYKTGFTPVDIENNLQLMAYAAAALNKNPTAKQVTVAVIQPRIEHSPLVQMTVSPEVIIKWGQYIIDKAEEIKHNNYDTLSSGAWCKYCPAAHCCPQLATHTEETNQLMLLQDQALAPSDALRVLQLAPELKSFIKNIEEHYTELLKGGAQIPGMYLAEQRTNRVWKHPDKVKQLIESNGLDHLIEEKLPTPATLEREAPEIMWAPLYIKPQGKKKLKVEKR